MYVWMYQINKTWEIYVVVTTKNICHFTLHRVWNIAPAKFWPRSQRESRRVFGRRDCWDLGEISARSWWDLKIVAAKNSPRSRRDLKISSRFSTRSWQDRKISAAKNSPRFSPRSQNLMEILAEILAKIWKSRRDSRRDLKILAAKNSTRISTRFQVRSSGDPKV